MTEEDMGTAVIVCGDCYAVGPVTAAQSRHQAWQRWNARHGDGIGKMDGASPC